MKYVPLSLFQAHSKRFPIQSRCFYGILDVRIMDEMENDTSHHVYTLFTYWI